MLQKFALADKVFQSDGKVDLIFGEDKVLSPPRQDTKKLK